MAKVRNFILEHSDCEVCVMMDADVQYLGYFENGKVHTLNPKELKREIIEWYHQAKDLNTVLFGVNLQSDYKFYEKTGQANFLHESAKKWVRRSETL